MTQLLRDLIQRPLSWRESAFQSRLFFQIIYDQISASEGSDSGMKKTIISLLCILCFMVACDEGNASSKTALAEEVFKNANEVFLLVSGDGLEWMQSALECHGKEEQCADRFINRIPEPMKVTSESRDQYLARIKNDYKSYPAPLREEALRISLVDAISKNVTAGLTPVIVDDAQNYLNKKDALIVVARLFIYRELSPAIATLSLSFYRPNVSNQARFQSIYYERTTVIPLNLSEQEIADRLSTVGSAAGLHLVKWSH